MILIGPGCAYHDEVIETFQSLGITLDVRAEIASTAATVQAVRAGMGIALMPTADFTLPPEGTTVRELHDVDLARGIGIVHPRAAEPHSPLTRQVLTAIRKSASLWRTARPRRVSS